MAKEKARAAVEDLPLFWDTKDLARELNVTVEHARRMCRDRWHGLEVIEISSGKSRHYRVPLRCNAKNRGIFGFDD